MVRVNELLKREISTIIERLIAAGGEGLITVTDVQTSPDLRHSTVYVSIYHVQGSAEATLKHLQGRRIEIQRILSKNVRLKYTPVLRFKLDNKQEAANRMYNLLDNLDVDP